MANKTGWVGVWAHADFFEPAVIRKILVQGQFCDWRSDEPFDSETVKESIKTLGGYFLSGKLSKEDHQGLWLAGSSGQNSVQLMIPWRFVHMVIVGSPEQVKKFGFNKK